MSIKVDIVISGAGPVGLYFAYLMATNGHSVYILDFKSGPTNQSRAAAITSRTMEILESKGLADDLMYEASVKTGLRFFKDGVHISQINSGGDTNYPFVTGVPQGTVEDIFTRCLEGETDTRVHWKTELVSYVQHDDHVVSVVRDVDTKEETVVESTYIIGADGTHSKVRKGNPEWTYKGVALATKFALADVLLEGAPLKMDKGSGFMKGARIMGVFDLNPVEEIEGNPPVFRIFCSLDDYRVNEETDKVTHGILKKDTTPPTQEFIQQCVDEMCGPTQIKIKDVVWSSYFTINERMANGFRRGRAFLIGDAAHCHSPAGGQGMNLGIQDADNLAWKMSNVLRGIVADSEKLLDSYNAERAPHVESTIKATSSGTKFGLSDTAIAHTVRAMVLRMAFSVPAINNYAFTNMMQQNVMMSGDFIGASDKGLLQAGTFLPFMDGLRQSYFTRFEKGRRRLQRTSLQDILLKNCDYTAMLVTTGYSSTEPSLNCAEKFWNLLKKYPVRRLIIQSNWHVNRMKLLPYFVSKDEADVAERSFYCEERMDSSLSVTNRVGLHPFLVDKDHASPHALVIIRPDLYVVESKLVYKEQDVEKALSYFDLIFN